jgi:acetolactate synthase-1/2/3 large subunit
MGELTGGQVLVRCLENEGVEVVFGMPGINVLHLYDGLRESSIRHVSVRHEQAAAFMADAYARVTGRPGVCVTTAGPGLTNALTGLATSYSDSVPVLALAGEISSNLIGKKKGVLHEIDQTSLSRPVAAKSYCIMSCVDIPKVMEQAFNDLRKERARPVYVGLPDDVLEATSDFNLKKQKPQNRTSSTVNNGSLREAADLLSHSRFPVILAGGGVASSSASQELVEVAQLLCAPVITTIMGAGSIPSDHPLFLCRSRMPRVVDEVFRKADVMLAVGTRFSSLSMSRWALKVPENLIHVDIDREEIGKNYPAKIGVCGDAKAVLREIAVKLQTMPKSDRSDWRKTWEGLRNSVWEELKRSNPTEVNVVVGIRNVLERNAIVASDTTIPSYWMQRIFPIYEPRTYLYPFGYVAMGYALPAAIAAKIAFPERQVIAVCGDGGFMVTCQELATAVENRLGIPILLHNNRGYGVLKHFQDIEFEGRRFAVDLLNPDFAKLADSFGARASMAETAEQIGPCLRDALRFDLPTIIEFRMPFSPPR